MSKNSKKHHKTVGVVVPLWDCYYMLDYIYTFLFSTVAYVKIFDEHQIKELLRYQYEPLFRSQRIFKLIETEQATSIHKIGSAFNSIIANKSHREGYEVLVDVVAAQQELGQRYFVNKEQAEDIRMDKIHALLEVVKDKEEIERQISELTYQIELHTVNRKGL